MNVMNAGNLADRLYALCRFQGHDIADRVEVELRQIIVLGICRKLQLPLADHARVLNGR